MNQLAQFVASHHELRSTAPDQLQSEHERLRTERDEDRSRLTYAADELKEIREKLGTVAPADVQHLASECETLRVEVDRLRTANDAFRTDQFRREALIVRLEEKVQELAPLQGERDALAEKLKARDVELSEVRAARDFFATSLAEERGRSPWSTPSLSD